MRAVPRNDGRSTAATLFRGNAVSSRLVGGRTGRSLVVGAAALSALLVWSASPSSPLDTGWIAWIGLVPVAVVALASPDDRARRAAVPLAYGLYLELLLVPALPFGIAAGQWGDPLVPVMIGDSPVIAVAVLAIPLFTALLYLLRFGQPWAPARTPARLALVLAVLSPALAWTALDFARVRLDPGGYFGALFATQHETVALGLSALAGPWTLTFAIVSVNYTLALATVGTARVAVPAVAAAALGIGALAGATALATEPENADHVAIAAVQPGFDRAEYADRLDGPMRRDGRDRAALPLIDELAPLTRTAAEGGAEIVVWPEATVWVDPQRHEPVRDALLGLARETGASLIVPYFLDRSASGAAIAVLPQGEMSPARPKQRPMWFLGERSDGGGPGRIDAGPALVGTLLGVDLEAPHVARDARCSGASLLASSTHDWRRLAAFQRAFARVSAAATGTPLVRSDWRFGSAVFDARGRTAADTGPGRSRSVAAAEVAPAAPTPYVRLGDALAWGALAWGALACAAVLRVAVAAGRPAGARRRVLRSWREAARRVAAPFLVH